MNWRIGRVIGARLQSFTMAGFSLLKSLKKRHWVLQAGMAVEGFFE